MKLNFAFAMLICGVSLHIAWADERWTSVVVWSLVTLAVMVLGERDLKRKGKGKDNAS